MYIKKILLFIIFTMHIATTTKPLSTTAKHTISGLCGSIAGIGAGLLVNNNNMYNPRNDKQFWAITTGTVVGGLVLLATERFLVAYTPEERFFCAAKSIEAIEKNISETALQNKNVINDFIIKLDEVFKILEDLCLEISGNPGSVSLYKDCKTTQSHINTLKKQLLQTLCAVSLHEADDTITFINNKISSHKISNKRDVFGFLSQLEEVDKALTSTLQKKQRDKDYTIFYDEYAQKKTEIDALKSFLLQTIRTISEDSILKTIMNIEYKVSSGKLTTENDVNNSLSTLEQTYSELEILMEETAQSKEYIDFYQACKMLKSRIFILKNNLLHITSMLKYQEAEDIIVSIENKFSPAMSDSDIISIVHSLFDTAWPLIDAKNYIKKLLSHLETAKEFLNVAMQQDFNYQEFSDFREKCLKLESEIKELKNFLIHTTGVITQNKTYQDQLYLYENYLEAERKRQHEAKLQKEKQEHEKRLEEEREKERSREREHQKKLERERQEHEAKLQKERQEQEKELLKLRKKQEEETRIQEEKDTKKNTSKEKDQTKL